MNVYEELKTLERENPEYKYYRYFDCDGSPYECDIFLIGINPANGLLFDKVFWDYCNSDGFNLNSWLKDYQQDRFEKGRTRNSPTRVRIELLRKSLLSNKLLNCNIYSKDTKRLKDLDELSKNIDVFKILMDHLSPKRIILHGNVTKKVFEKIVPNYSSQFENWKLHTILVNGRGVKIISVPHLFNMALAADKNNQRNIERIVKVIKRIE